MGNAVTCLSGGQMVKLIGCLAGGPVVKVMLPDATVEEYDHAIQVAELASMYPNYAVVHCSREKPSLGRRREVIIMKMDELLVPGEAYILYPIPRSFNDRVHVSATETRQDHPSSVPETDGETKDKVGSGQLEGSITAEELGKSLSRCLMGPAIGRKVPSEGLSLLDLEKDEWEQTEKKEKKEQKEKTAEADSALEPSAWTPDLYQISED